MTDKLSIYNGALRNLGERRHLSLTEENTARRAFDADYDKCLAWCVEQGQWIHAREVVKLSTPSTVDLTPIGWSYAFDLPADYTRMYEVSVSGTFGDPFNQWEIRGRVFYCNLPELWIKYISATKGIVYAAMSASFVDFVEFALATRNVLSITKDKNIADKFTEKSLKRALAKAQNIDTMSQPPRARVPGSWLRSRNYSTQDRE